MLSHSRARFGALVATAVLAAAWCGTTGAASADEEPGDIPAFGQVDGAALPTETKPAIAVDNGVSQVSDGTRVEYRISVQNQSTFSELATTVSANLPRGLGWESADNGSVKKNNRVEWEVRVAPGRSTVLTLKGTVGAAPEGVDRLALVVCAEGDTPVCATDMDGIAPAEQVSWPVATASVLGALGVIGGLAWFLRRRKKGSAKALQLPAQSTATVSDDFPPPPSEDKEWNHARSTAMAAQHGASGPVPGGAESPETVK